MQVYFCDPHPQSPWLLGTNENTNCCYGNTSREASTCLLFASMERPRGTLGFQTPASRIQQSVASTV
jgi:IS30 family transposase